MYTNSSLATYKRISPNKSVPRNHAIDRITPHCLVGQLGMRQAMDMGMFQTYNEKNGCSCNYLIGTEGAIGLMVEEKDRSWCSSSRDNDNRAVTIECASDTKDPYKVNGAVYNALISLCVDICRRNGKTRLLWLGSKEKTLAYEPKADEAVLSAHRWFANKACPGDYLYSRFGQIADAVTTALGGHVESDKYVVRLSFDKPETQTNSFNNLDYAKAEADRYPGYSVYVAETGECVYTSHNDQGYTPQEWIAIVSPIAVDLARIYKILPSMIIGQTCGETGFGKTDLTRKYNIIGMKVDLINSTWQEYSTWTGEKYGKYSPEGSGGLKWSEFRVYHSFRQCLEDYCNFLLHVRNDKGLKYARIQGVTDPVKAINIVYEGTGTHDHPEGYATDPEYVRKVLDIINRYNLTKYDMVMTEPDKEPEKEDVPMPTGKTMIEYMTAMWRRVISDIKEGKVWRYYNSNTSGTFEAAERDKNYRANCATIANWCLRYFKVFKAGNYFYGSNGRLCCSEETMNALVNNCTMINVKGNKTVDQCIQDEWFLPGDIVTYSDMSHTNIYAGNGKWYDAGHAYCTETGEGARFIKWIGGTVYGNQRVAYIITYPKRKKVYRVRLGIFKQQSNVNKLIKSVKKKFGLGCFVEHCLDGTHVFCGSYGKRAEAVKQRKMFEEAHFDAKVVSPW